MSLGFEQAGFDVVAAVDLEQINVDTYKKNFPNCKTWCADLSAVSGNQIRKETSIIARDIDVVFAGPPCQGFSLIGKRLKDDPRNSLLYELARLIGELSPSYFVVENVAGIRLGDSKSFLDGFQRRVASAGYKVVEPIQVLDAAEFGVPQRRARVFILGHKLGLHAPAYPKPVYVTGMNGDHCGPTVWDAICDLPRIDNYEYLLSTDEYRGKLGEPSDYAKVLRGDTLDSNDLSYAREHNGTGLTGCLRTLHTAKTVSRFRKTKQGSYEDVSRFHRLAKGGLANTLRAGTGPEQGSFMAPRPIHPFQHRCITVREAARLHSFPDWFTFHPTKWHGFRQIGNSVPPRLARAIAESVRNALSIR
jgi:DNA (cytosine-5)-methyltransferase 1